MKRFVLTTTAMAALLAATPASGIAGPPELIHINSPVARGGHAWVDARAWAPNICGITVSSRGHELHRKAFKPEDPTQTDGRLVWGWEMPSNARLGTWHVRISCGSAGSLNTTFRVTRCG
jgi:hypothetical protein